jgi:hypothetical protein
MSETTDSFPLIDSASSITSASISLDNSLSAHPAATAPSSCLVARSIKALAQSLSLQLSARAFASLCLFIRTAYSKLIRVQSEQYTVLAARSRVVQLFPLAADWFDDWLLRIRNHQTTFHAAEDCDSEDAALFCCERLVKDYYSLLNLDVLLALPVSQASEAPIRMKRNAVLAVLGLLSDLVTWTMQAGEVVLSERQTASSGSGCRMLREAEIDGILQCAPLFRQFSRETEPGQEQSLPAREKEPAEETDASPEADLVEVIGMQRKRISDLEDEVTRLQHILQIVLTKQHRLGHSQHTAELASFRDLSIGNSLQTLR